MKKLVAWMLAVVMSLGMLTGCSGGTEKMAETDKPTESQDEGSADKKKEPAENVNNEDLMGEGMGKDYGLGPCGFDLDRMVDRIGADEVKKLRIGVSVSQQVNDWQIAWAEEFRRLGDEYGIDIQILSADDDPAKDVENMKTFAAQDVDAIIVYPKSFASAAATMSEINPTIPIINSLGDGVTEVDVSVEENTPQALMAYTTADQMAADANGEDRYVLVLDNSSDVFYLRERREGFQEYVEDKYPNIHVVDVRLDKTEDGWLNQAKESMLANPEINAIFATYTLPMMGGYNAAEQLGVKDMSIYGIDANEATLDLLKENKIQGLYIQFPTVHAYWTLFNTLRVLSGEKIEPVHQDFPETSPYAVYTATPDTASEAKNILYPGK